jgi:regulator of sirC expression with transglutaminase-like and TPR domain
MNQNEIKALVSLLDDDDYEVINHIKEKIISMGDVLIPFLETAWENNFSPVVQRRIEELIHTLQLQSLSDRLQDWKENEQEDLLKGIWLVACFQYPDLDLRKVTKELDQIYHEVWLSHRAYASPHDKVKHLNNILFSKLGFSSNTQNFHSPSNSMINIVLESRKGNPISLCIVYMLVAQRLKMPIYGINLPNIFVLTYKSEETQFYINAFNRGLIFSKPEIDNYIAQLNIPATDRFYEPCSNVEIIQRVMRNLIVAFEKLNEEEKAKELKSLLGVLDD